MNAPRPAATKEPDVPSAWMTWLTTEHYNLQTQRVATIGEANGRASIFLGAVSAGLIALGFQSGAADSAGAVVFEMLVLSSLVLLGTSTFLRCLQIAVDDWEYGDRISHVRSIYVQLMPTLGAQLTAMARPDQSVVMLRPLLGRWQPLLTVAGTLAIVTAILLGTDLGVLTRALGAPRAAAIATGAVVGTASAAVAIRFQAARWHGAERARQLAGN